MRKILVFTVIFSFLLSQGPFLLADDSTGIGNIAAELRLTEKERIVPKEEGYEKLQCPSCHRDFEIKIDPNDMELQRGIKKITCPYDGTEFYPLSQKEAESEFQYETVRCPSCGKEFKGYIDVKAILSGQSQVLVCPYDKKQFYFKAEGFKPARRTLTNVQTVICPTDKRTFKAYIDPKNPTELVCPYDGTKFFPTPESIMPKLRGGGSQEEVLLEGDEMSANMLYNLGMRKTAGETGGAAGYAPNYLSMEETPSRIEMMFSEQIPLNISKDIRQFGYDIFKPDNKKGPEQKKDSKREPEAAQGENKILGALLGAKGEEALKTLGDETGGLSEFSAPVSMPMISDYILGPGDVLTISVWGQIQETFTITIDEEGKVILPKVGPLYLWGLKFVDAEKLIRESLLKLYSNIQINISMSRLRNIKVFVLGEVIKPGAYTMSALSNTFHALYAAGGPTKLGSMRGIKLIRNSASERSVDLYNILLKGDNSQDYKLQANDTIFVPPIGDVIGIAGNVKRPAVYEISDKISLADAIEMAGGVSSVGYVQRIQLERIQDHLRKVVLDLEFKSLSDLKNSRNNLELQDGDLALIFPITSIRYNFVSVAGNILRPGDYELKEGMRLKDLLDKAGGILQGTYLERAEISRFRADQTREIMPFNLNELIDGKEEANITLKEWDIVTIYSRRGILPDLFVEIDGAVNKPGRYELTDNMKISDLIFRAGGMKRNALMSNGELFRNFSGGEPKIISVDYNRVLSKDTAVAGENDLALEGDDHLFIREDVAREEKVIVTLAGEFKYPGKYAVEKGTRLSEVIKRAGGYRASAFLDGCVYTRERVRIAQKKMIRNFLDSEQKALLQEQAALAVGMTQVQADSRDELIEYRKKLSENLDTMEGLGRVLIKFDPDMRKFEASEYNIIVEDQDFLSIPTAPATVQVVGNVYGPTSVTFSEGKGVDYYINKCGGLTKYGDAGRIFIIRANGETISSFVRAVKVKRGDTVVIPEEIKYKTLPGLVLKDVAQVLYQAALGAAVTITAVNSM